MNFSAAMICLAAFLYGEVAPIAPGLAPCESSFYVHFVTCDGKPQQMFVRSVPAAVESRPPLIILHFASGHSGRMLPLARSLAERGYPCYAIDLLGHGQSSIGEPVYDDTILGLRSLVRLVCQKHQVPQVGLVGSSMGGEISVMYAIEQSLAGEETGARVGSVVAQGLYTPWQRDVAWRFSGPTLFLYLTDPIPPLFVSPPIVLSNWMFPPRHIYSSPELRRDFRADPLRKRAFPGRVVVKAARYRLELPSTPIDTPLLLVHGTKDRVVRVRYAERVYDGLSRYFATLELAEIPGASHGLFEEETETASALIDDWLLKTLP